MNIGRTQKEKMDFEIYLKSAVNERMKFLCELKSNFCPQYIMKSNMELICVYPDEVQKLIDSEMELINYFIKNETERFLKFG